MITEISDTDQIVDAILALKSSPWLDVLIPAVSGVIGVAAGFFLSVAKASSDRKIARRDEITGAIRTRRQEAVDVFSAEAKWAVFSIGKMYTTAERQRHRDARENGPDLFDKTGNVADERLTAPVRSYLSELDMAYQSRVKRDVVDGYPTLNTENVTREFLSDIRAEVSAVRLAAQQWVDEDRDSKWFAQVLEPSLSRVRTLVLDETPVKKPEPTPPLD